MWTRCESEDRGAPGPDLIALHGDLMRHSLADYDRLHFCDKETQMKYFRLQFQLARLSGLPM